MNPYEQGQEMAQQRGECDFCAECGYKQCRCAELEAIIHAQQVEDTRKAIETFRVRAAGFRAAVARFLGRTV